ncbi:MAG: YHS domain-containing protein [Planctomycetota bacterium]|nr:YHS domain-containing protein [Planctomycetota bacterium]
MNSASTFHGRIRSAGLIAGMRPKIGVMGGAGQGITFSHLRKANALGRAIARHGCILVTGACPGLPLAAADGAKREGGFVIGISPGLSLDEHIYKYGSPAEGHDVLIYTGSGLMGREVVNIRSSDMVVIVGGRSGTLGELAIAYDEGKLIGVLKGTGGITGLVPRILSACKKETGARVIYESNPQRLVNGLIRLYQKDHFRHPSCFSSDMSTMKGHRPRTVRDVVCGMWIDPNESSIQVRYRKKTYYFCCSTCASSFRKDPQRFGKGNAWRG